MKFMKGSQGTTFNLSPSTSEKYNQMDIIEDCIKKNWHINFDSQVNERTLVIIWKLKMQLMFQRQRTIPTIKEITLCSCAKYANVFLSRKFIYDSACVLLSTEKLMI